MYYLKDGLGSYKGCKQIGAVLAVLFSAFCLSASFGIGNMSQVNSIAANMTSAFSIPATVTGIVMVIIGALVIVGGLKRIAAVTEKPGSLYGHRLCHRCTGDLLCKYRSRGCRIYRHFQRSIRSARRGRRYRRFRCEVGSDLGHEARRVLQRSRPWFLRYGTFQFQCKRTRASGYVGHLRGYSLTLWSYVHRRLSQFCPPA